MDALREALALHDSLEDERHEEWHSRDDQAQLAHLFGVLQEASNMVAMQTDNRE